jgi:magnesium-transporting ATPase (P-type)
MENSTSGLLLNNDSKKWMKLNATLSAILLFFAFIYTIYAIRSFYRTLAFLTFIKAGSKEFIFNFRIYPVLLFSELVLIIISYFFIYTGFSKQYKSIEKQDNTADFNKGVRFINYSLIVTVIYFLVIFSQIVFKHFYFKK